MTLFEVLVQTARALEALHENSATGGSTTTIVDTKLTILGWNDDDFNGGTAFIIRDAGGAGAAPENESRFITDYVASTGTVTVDAFSAAVAAGDWYGVTLNRYPRGAMVSKINEALRELGDVPTVDTTSLTTLSNTLEYALPVAAKRDLRQVWLARSLTAPWKWEQQLGVRQEWAAANTAGNLIFPSQPVVGYKIKLVYMAPHPQVQADTDVISDYVSIDWLALDAARKAARLRLEGSGADDTGLSRLINDLTAQTQMAMRRRMMPIPSAQPVLSIHNG
jgi:hypothetical protein